MQIYELSKDKVLRVSGSFEYIGEIDGKVYVKGEHLSEPFIPSILPQSLVDSIQLALTRARVEKEKEMNAKCNELLTYFESDALGESYIYDMSVEDQLNLMALATSKADSYFRCHKVGEPKANIPHTSAQLKKVYADGIKYKSDTIYACGVLKAYLLTLEDIEQIKTLQWEDYESIKAQMEQSEVAQ